MASPHAHVSAAKRVVAIQGQLVTARQIDPNHRVRLETEQRTIWEAIFPDVPFDQIAELAA